MDLSTGVFTHYRHNPADPSSLSRGSVRALLVGKNGTLWVGTAGGGLARYDRTHDAFTRIPSRRDGSLGPGTDVVLALLEDPEGNIWLGTDHGLDRYDPNTGSFSHYEHDSSDPTSLSPGGVHALYLDQTGVFWVGTENGVSAFSWTAPRFPLVAYDATDPNSISDPGVWTFLVDRAGVLWVGTEAGLDRFDPGTGGVMHYRNRPGDASTLTAGWVMSLFEDSEGTFWVGTRRSGEDLGGLNRFDRGTGRVVERFVHDTADPTSLKSDNPWMLFEDSQDQLWVLSGGTGCLNRMDRSAGAFTAFCHNPEDPNTPSWDDSRVVVEHPAGVLWFATWGGGLNRLDTRTEEWTHYQHNPSEPNSPSDDYMSTLHLGDDGLLWLGTYGAGLDRFDPETGTFTHYSEANSGLPNDVVYSIEQDAEGSLWLSTNQGLTRFNPETGVFRTFGLEHGLQDLEFNAVTSYQASNGEMFFGGINGFNRFFPDQIAEDESSPTVVLTDLRIRGQRVAIGPDSPLREALPYTQTLELGADQRDIAITFAALEFTNTSRNRYRYRLEGYDDDWRDAGPERTATYTNLDPGRYTLLVQAATGTGIWSEEGASLNLIVHPPWTKTWWAFLLYAGLIGGAGFALSRYRRRRLVLQHQLEIEQVETETLRELDQAKSRFFANVSHEFRTPLTLTIGPLDDMKAGLYGPLSESMAAPVDLARRNAHRVLGLINQILDIARLEAGKTRLQAKKIDLGAFVGTHSETFRLLSERKKISFEISSPSGLAEIWADPPQVEKIIANLLSNAFKFTPEGGAVRVSVVVDDTARVMVRDNGSGIPAADLPFVFDRFHRVNESEVRMQPGTGIGLALAREIADLHGGTLAVESEEGFGSTFTLTLPLGHAHIAPDQMADNEDAVSAAAEVSQTAPVEVAHVRQEGEFEALDPDVDGDRTTVLIVEDHPDVRAYVRRHLEPDFRVLEAEDGEAGLAMAKDRLPDLVLSDVMMPGMDGFQLCRALKTSSETDFIPVILLTAKAEQEDKLEGLGEEADAYLTKPFDPAELRTRIENLITIRQRLRERFRKEGIALAIGEEASPGKHGAESTAVSPVDEEFLGRVRTAIEANMSEDTFSVERLANAVGVSRGHLYRQLRAMLNQTPTDVIRTARMERAAQLLRARAGNVSEVAYAVGFKSVGHFSDSFVRDYGCRPSPYAAETGKS